MVIIARFTMILVLVLATAAGAAQAQGPGRQGLTSPASRSPVVRDVVAPSGHSAARSVVADSIPPSHWKTGAIIGGAIGFPFGFLAFASVNDGSTASDIGAGLLGGLGIAAIFGLIGGLIGSFFHH